MDLKKIDWRSLQKYTNANAIKDLDSFLDNLPLNVGYNALIAAGIMLLLAGASVWFVSGEAAKVRAIHAELMQVEALKPPIPVIKYIPVDRAVLKDIGEKLAETYVGIAIAAGNNGEVVISSQETDYFPQFLATISYFQKFGKSWRVETKNLCVGRDCKRGKLSIKLKVDVVRVGEPESGI